MFYHLCYEGSIDLGSITDPAQRHALEVQIMEFGQIPKQVFKHPHPKRIIHNPIQHLLVDRSISETSDDLGNFPVYHCLFVLIWICVSTDIDFHYSAEIVLEKVLSIQGHREYVRSLRLVRDGEEVASVGNDGLLRVHSLLEGQLMHSVALSPTPLSSVISLPEDNRFIVGSFDNSM